MLIEKFPIFSIPANCNFARGWAIIQAVSFVLRKTLSP